MFCESNDKKSQLTSDEKVCPICKDKLSTWGTECAQCGDWYHEKCVSDFAEKRKSKSHSTPTTTSSIVAKKNGNKKTGTEDVEDEFVDDKQGSQKYKICVMSIISHQKKLKTTHSLT